MDAWEREFDFNHDGELDDQERLMAFESLDEDGSDDEDEEDFLTTELEMAGIDPFEFELMDEDEQRDALEDAGLDPDDFDLL